MSMNKKIALAGISLCVLTLAAPDSFVKPQKKPVIKITAEDCVEDSLAENRSFAHIFQSLGKTLDHLGRIMEKKGTYAQDMIEDTKKGTLKKATKEQLSAYHAKQQLFDNQVACVERALAHVLGQLDSFASEYAQWLDQFEKEVHAIPVKQKSA